MKKTYNAPEILVTEVKNTIMAGSIGMDETSYEGNLNSARSRRYAIEWLDDEEDDL